MPPFDENELLDCLKSLVNIDKDWFPQMVDGQFYTRLNHISTEATLGVKTPSKTKLYAMLNPISLNSKQLSLKCSDNVYKNWPLGHGQYRISGNLGPLVPYVADAKNNGFDDVLWLLDNYIKEMTILNVFTLWMSRYGTFEMITPPNDGCIMNGVSRQTLLDLKDDIKKEFNIDVIERQISIHEVINAYKEDRLIEMFGASTHCPLQPIKKVVYQDHTIDLANSQKDQYAVRFNKMILDLMTGPTSHQWITPME